MMKNKEIVKNITRIILKNKQKMIREEDLKNLYEGNDFDEIISEVYTNLNKVGFELISTKFLDQKYYILTAEGKDDNITPSQYGTLALVLALSNQVDENIKVEDLKSMFSEVWDTDIEFLIKQDYLREINIKGLEIIKVTPIGKAILKNIIHSLDLKNLLNIFETK
ncbi:MAG: hypothetical protein ACTSR8_13815 [Promethearchaeota archaeon]